MEHHHDAESQPTKDHTRQYVSIFVLLGIITLAEVGVFYVDALQSLLVPLILGLSAIKFLLVVMYYMHLKADHKVLTLFFAVGAVMAITMFVIVPWIVIWQYA